MPPDALDGELDHPGDLQLRHVEVPPERILRPDLDPAHNNMAGTSVGNLDVQTGIKAASMFDCV